MSEWMNESLQFFSPLQHLKQNAPNPFNQWDVHLLSFLSAHKGILGSQFLWCPPSRPIPPCNLFTEGFLSSFNSQIKKEDISPLCSPYIFHEQIRFPVAQSSYCCCNKLSQIWWSQQHKIIIVQFLDRSDLHFCSSIPCKVTFTGPRD